MLRRGEILERYRRLRALCVEHHGAAINHLARAAIVEQAKRLGLADGRVLLTDSHEELSLIFDLALYQRRPGRSRAIDRYAKGTRPAAGSEAALVLDAMCRARFGLWRVAGQHDVCGIIVSHVLDERDDAEQTWIVDEGLEATAAPGTCLAARLCRVEPFSLFAGATVPVSPTAVETALLALPARRYMPRKDLADDPKLPAAIYRTALQNGVFDNTA